MHAAHITVELQKFQILMSPRVSSPVIRIRPAAQPSLVAVVKGRRPGPCHLYHHRFPEHTVTDPLGSRLRSHSGNPAHGLVCPGQETGMIVVRKLIHGHHDGRHLHPAHMIIHSPEESFSIAIEMAVILIAVLLHSGQEPCDRFHKCIVIHNGIPFISLKPAVGISIMLRQNQRLRIRLFYGLPELLPEIMVKLTAVSQVRRHIQTPSVHAVRRRNPFPCNIQNIFLQFWRLLVI